MAINFNTTPYHDNFDETKQFYRILFRPGRAVQARELTQLQTTLQNQITRFGQNVFKEGSLVLPGHSAFDLNAKYVKLTTSYNSINSDDVLADLVGVEITGQTSGVKALVLDYVESIGDDPPTIYVRYLNSGNSKIATSFNNSEVLTSADQSISLQVASSSATGAGIRFIIQPGIIFVKGVFAYFDEQSIIVTKYLTYDTKSVGFRVSESIVTSDDDESLLDPASGSYNYFAPGADRYKISLDLTAIDFIDASTDEDYVELARIENGKVISIKKSPDYNILADTLARRTFDESGNYTVRPYGLEITEHLRTSNADLRDGLLTSDQGGNASIFVGIINPGKSYVLGYEIENLKTQYVPITKSRDYVSVNNGTVTTEIGNFVLITGTYSVPDILTHSTLNLYSRFTTTSGSPAGTLVGTAKPRALEYHSGTGAATVYKLYLFDIQMKSPFKFEKNVKQLYFNNSGFEDFTANVVTNNVALTGTITVSAGSKIASGSGTRFTTELAANSYILVDNTRHEISSINSDYQVYLLDNAPFSFSGRTGYRLEANIKLPEKNQYYFELPYKNIKTVDPTNVETIYYTRKAYDRTLSTGSVTITASTNERFTSFATDDYIAINKTTGAIIPLESANVTLGGSPSGTTVTLALGASYGSNEVRFITNVQKTNNAADKKVKTLNSIYIDFTANTNATATLNLAQADIYQLQNVLMSSNTFGNTFLMSESSDITSRYTLDNGQRKTHYDIGKLKLKPGQPAPTGPVRVYFKYFSHSAGDYCSADSYSSVDYDKIPAFFDGTKVIQLRDVIDFRPVIDTNGATFTSPTQQINQTTEFITDYQYYLGRIDKIIIDSTGTVKTVSGPSSLTPEEPSTPDNSMALFVLEQQPYVYDLKRDIKVNVVDNRRFTMRDIGRIENRVKNLEYYTELSLLELQAKAFTIKDGQGLDRFKNGFIVDNFTGHNVGDQKNPDYSVSMDFVAGEIRPMFVQINLPLNELVTDNDDRVSKNYFRTGNLFSLPYTVVKHIESNVASRVENVNPFNVFNDIGSVTLDPPSDTWFENEKLPDVYSDQEQVLSTLQNDSAAKGTYNTIWNNWEIVWSGGRRVEQRTGTTYKTFEKIDTTTSNDVVVSKVVIPKMRSKSLRFAATGLKANTKVFAYFDDFNVTKFCQGDYTSTGTLLSDASVSDRANDVFASYVTNYGNIITDSSGVVTGTFNYDANFFNLPTGSHRFRLTDSPTNGADSETSAEAVFIASGERRQIRNEIVSTRYTYATQESTYDSRAIADPPPPPPAPPFDPEPTTPVYIPDTTAPIVPTVISETDEIVDVSKQITVPYGQFLGSFCEGTTLYGVYSTGDPNGVGEDGAWYRSPLEYNSTSCGYVRVDTSNPEVVTTPTIIQVFTPGSAIVEDFLLTDRYSASYDQNEDLNKVRSISGLPDGQTRVKEFEESDRNLQTNISNAVTDPTYGSVAASNGAQYFQTDGRVKWDVLAPALVDGSWATGLDAETRGQIKEVKDELFLQNMLQMKQSDGTVKLPDSGMVREIYDAWVGGMTEFSSNFGEPTVEKAAHLAASMVTAGLLASQTAGSSSYAWNTAADNIVSGQPVTIKSGG